MCCSFVQNFSAKAMASNIIDKFDTDTDNESFSSESESDESSREGEGEVVVLHVLAVLEPEEVYMDQGGQQCKKKSRTFPENFKTILILFKNITLKCKTPINNFSS